MPDAISQARAFLGGEVLAFAVADALWQQLKEQDEISLARSVLAKMRHSDGALLDQVPVEGRDELCRQEALLTSKDPELSSSIRHDRALKILGDGFNLDSSTMDGDGETLGIAGGIYKRRWSDLGQIGDLKRAATLYERGARGPLGEDAYPQINAAFLDDLLAAAGDEPAARRQRAKETRQRIVAGLPESSNWWNAAARAEALFGLGLYGEATAALGTATEPRAPWKLQAVARQLGTLAHLHHRRPLEVAEIRAFFEALLPGQAEAVRSALAGKVGLALSGGGFRASFYHLGVLARLAELNVLRHVEVLSCVSGGSIVGACYWLALRRRLLASPRPGRQDYVRLVQELIEHFLAAVARDLRGQVQPGRGKLVWRLLHSQKGALDPELTAQALEEHFYRSLLPGIGPLFMHHLEFTPADHDAALSGSLEFHPSRHNWLRVNKVPVLVLNATTVNTGHAWQFTPTWMGESPWAVYEAADSIPRLEWAWYEPGENWQISLGQAVAASACVPMIFAPLQIPNAYDDIDVQLVDGGVHDNQGTVSLLALDCNVLIVSDASGQLLLEHGPQPGLSGLAGYAVRSMDTLMARVRLANYADLAARRRSGLLRGFMFLHMKAGLDADPIRPRFSQEAYATLRAPLSPAGVRKDFQEALAELRTDLDDFTEVESHALMACGYKMATMAFARDLAELTELWDEPSVEAWPFAALLAEITSTAAATPRRKQLLAELRQGATRK
jgi:predicted acylesterase/phospholipase RssA